MIDLIDGAYVAAQIRLVRQVRRGTILLLEGHTDAKLLGRFTNPDTCEIEIGFGKANVIEAIDLLEDEGFQGIVGVVDADFDRLTNVTHSLDNLCVTDVHDLDLMIFLSPSLDRYVAEHGNQERIKKDFLGDLSAIRSKIIDCCLPLSHCRLASSRRKLMLRFNGLKHDELVSQHTLTMDQIMLIKTVTDRSSSTCSPATLLTFMNREAAEQHDPHQLVNGHDTAAILGIALRKLIGDRRDVHTWASEIEAGLRLAFDWEAMVSTGLYQCLRAWEGRNPPYRIFSRSS